MKEPKKLKKRRPKGVPTKRQRAVLRMIERFIQKHGYAPTLREIGDSMGIGSTNGVMTHLDALEKKGRIQRTAGVARSISIVWQECTVTLDGEQMNGLFRLLPPAEEGCK